MPWLLPLIVAIAAFPSQKKAPPDTVTGELGAQLDAQVLAVEPKFWGAVLAVQEGEILLSKGYGFADEKQAPNTAKTLFDVGSLSKQFTATAVLRLDQQKKLSIDDRVSKHLGKVTEDKRTLSIRHLLNHTSGFPRDTELPDRAWGTREALIEEALGYPLVTRPGLAFEYSNVNYQLLAAIVEVCAKRPFEVELGDLFAVAGLKNTGLAGSAKPKLDRSRASLRVATIDGTRLESSLLDYPWTWGKRGVTNVVTSLDDLLAWTRVLRVEKLLDRAHGELLFKPALADYACGWVVTSIAGDLRRIEHGGSTDGFGAMLALCPEKDVVIAVLTRAEDRARAVEARLWQTLVLPTPAVSEADK